MSKNNFNKNDTVIYPSTSGSANYKGRLWKVIWVKDQYTLQNIDNPELIVGVDHNSISIHRKNEDANE